MKRFPALALLALAGLLPACRAAGPAPVTRPVPLRADHPLIGAWQITTRDGSCTETWIIDRAGTALVTSNEEVGQMRFTISDRPSPRGYYKWTDTLFKDNGKKDCSGRATQPPVTTVNYVLMSPQGDRFVMCSAEDGRACFGPFVRVQGGEI